MELNLGHKYHLEKLVHKVLKNGERMNTFQNSFALNILHNAFFNHLRCIIFFVSFTFIYFMDIIYNVLIF